MANSVGQSPKSVEVERVKVWMTRIEKFHQISRRQIVVILCCRWVRGAGNEVRHQLRRMPHADSEDNASFRTSAACNDPSRFYVVRRCRVSCTERRVVPRVLEDNLDIAENSDVAVDACEPVLGIRLNVKFTCPWFEAIDQVDPIPIAGLEVRILSCGAQRPKLLAKSVDVCEKADVGLHCHLEGIQREEAGHTFRAHLLADSCDERRDEISQQQRIRSVHHVIENHHTKLGREIE